MAVLQDEGGNALADEGGNSLFDEGGGVVVLTGQTGAFSFAGGSATLIRSLLINGQAASLSFTANAPDTLRSLLILGDAGAFTFAGANSNLVQGLTFDAETGAFSFTGQDNDLLRSLIATMDGGAFTFSGGDADLLTQGRILGEAGVFGFDGGNAGLLRSLTFTGGAASFVFDGKNAALSIAGQSVRRVATASGSDNSGGGMTFSIKEGDTSPAFSYPLSPTSVDLTGASAVFIMSKRRGSSLKIDRSAASVTTATGTPTLQYDWLSADTDAAGVYRGEFEVTYADNSVETFPNEGFITITISKDLG